MHGDSEKQEKLGSRLCLRVERVLPVANRTSEEVYDTVKSLIMERGYEDWLLTKTRNNGDSFRSQWLYQRLELLSTSLKVS